MNVARVPAKAVPAAKETMMKITKRQIKKIIREEYNKLLRESAFHNPDLEDLAIENGVYYKDWYDVPGICESALQEGFMDLSDVDRANAELKSEGITSVEDAITYPNPRRLVDSAAVSVIDDAIAEYRRGRWPMHSNPKFAHSSYIPMLAWIASR